MMASQGRYFRRSRTCCHLSSKETVALANPCSCQNSKTLFLADKPEMRRCGLTYGRLRFTTETPEQCVQVLQRYQNGGNWTPEDLTRGLFYRGVE